MKQIVFDGRIGRDAEVSTTKGGKTCVKFSVANNSYNGGQRKTEWFEVTSYDPYVIENRVKYLTQGTYVIVSGGLNTEVSVSRTDGKIWLNQYITANVIDTPMFGKKDDAENANAEASQKTETEAPLSTYTAGTPTIKAQVEPAPKAIATPPTPQPSYAVSSVGAEADDDMPF